MECVKSLFEGYYSIVLLSQQCLMKKGENRSHAVTAPVLPVLPTTNMQVQT